MTAPTPAFWRRFAKETWERKPLAVPNFRAGITAIDEKRVFALLVSYANLCRKRGDADGFKFYIDGQRAHEQDVLQILPLKRDGDLLGYHRRMSALFEDYCLVCDELLRVSHAEEKFLAEFTRDLYRHVGFPNRFAEMGLYLGNYRRTPFGVHVDGCGVFSFPVVGKKKFRLWTPAYAAKNPDLDRAFEYKAHRKASSLLTAGPGGMTYWPSSAWHIAESKGEFSATWSLGVWVDHPLSAVLSAATDGLLVKALGAEANAGTTMPAPDTKYGEVTALPGSYERALKSFGKISEDDLREALLASWMSHLAKRGFKNTPSRTVKLGARIQLVDQDAPVLWRRAHGKISCAFADFNARDISENFLRLLLALNAGERPTVKDYLKGARMARDLEVLKALAAAGAFR